jgi:crotonobetainyl-CoA:carnitine CoA-transferase CaiB-like acyl-CoA transferase
MTSSDATRLPQPGPLDGVQVLEFAQAFAIPICGQTLADLGASVTKIEPPAGDAMRHVQGPIVPGESRGFTVINRGKRTICLDFAHAQSAPIVEALVRQADVTLVSLKPTDLPRYGLTYQRFAEIKPDIIYLDHVPMGPKGPYGSYGGYDVVAQGLSGMAFTTARTHNGVPINIRPAFNDVGTGYLSALAVTAALRHRDRTGEGQRVETSLLSTAIAYNPVMNSWFAAVDPPIWDEFERRSQEAQHSESPFEARRTAYEQTVLRAAQGNIYFRHYQTADGYMSIGCLSPSLNAKFRQVTGIDDPRGDPGFDLATDDGWQAMMRLVDEAETVLRSRTTDDWLDRFQTQGVPCAPMRTPPELFTEPQVVENDFIVELDHPVLGPYKTTGLPIRMDRTPTRIQGPAPVLDADTDAVLAEAGFDAAAIAQWRIDGVIGKNLRES